MVKSPYNTLKWINGRKVAFEELRKNPLISSWSLAKKVGCSRTRAVSLIISFRRGNFA